MTPFPSKLLGIDFGTQRIGLALSFGTLADPLEIIPNNAQTLDKLSQIVEQEGVKALVVGVSEGKMAELSKEFAAQIKDHLNLPVFFVDETLSTKKVEAKIHEAGSFKKHRRVDHLAAAEMLQEWIDTRMD